MQLEREKMALQRQQMRQASRSGGSGGRYGSTSRKQWGKAGVKDNNSGLQFTDPGGLPVSAATYAYQNGIPLEDVLSGDPSKYGQTARRILTGAIPLDNGNASYEQRLAFVRQQFPLLF